MKVKNFNWFKQLFRKGAIFVFTEFKFSQTDKGKARLALILNNLPPQDRNSKVYFVTLTSQWKKVYLTDKCDSTNLIKDSVLHKMSAYNLKHIDNRRAGDLYKIFIKDKFNYIDVLSDNTIHQINVHLKDFLKNPKTSKTISNKIKKAITP